MKEQEPPLVRKVRRRLHQWSMGLSGVVAVSGGPDSVALLRALVALRPDRPEGPLLMVHVNHQLRGAESEADEVFVRHLHARLVAEGAARLEACCVRCDVQAEAAAARANLEAHAREVRYRHLGAIAQAAGVAWVATGHTADDQAETVLHRLLRGTGLTGLRGIAARRPLGGEAAVEVIRPLLDITRAEVIAYLEQQSQDYRQDSSNLDLTLTRNRIRHELLPHLAERYNPAISVLLGRLARQAEEVLEEVERSAHTLLATAELPRAGALLILDRATLAAAPRSLVREVFRLVWQREGWSLDRMTFEHLDRLAGLCQGEEVVVDLPAGIRGRCRGSVLQLGPAGPSP